MASERYHVKHLALEADGTLCDRRSGDRRRFLGGQTAKLKFILILSRINSSLVGRLKKRGSREIYNEFAALLDKSVRIA